MTNVQSWKPLLKNYLICMHPHLLTYGLIIHITSVNNKVYCNLMNAMDARSYACHCFCSFVILLEPQFITYVCIFNDLYPMHLNYTIMNHYYGS